MRSISGLLLALVACSGNGNRPQAIPPRPGNSPGAPSLDDVGLVSRYMDRAADPCVDFYQYACGGWIANNPATPERPEHSRFDDMDTAQQLAVRDALARSLNERGPTSKEQDVANFFAACLDERAIDAAGISVLDAELATIKAIADRPSLLRAIAQLHQLRIWAGFRYAIQATPSEKGTIALVQGGLALPSVRFYAYSKSNAEIAELRRLYVDTIEKSLVRLGVKEADAGSQAHSVFALETKLAKAWVDDGEFDPARAEETFPWSKLAALYPGSGWTEYARTLGVPADARARVVTPDYFAALNEELTNTSPAIWRAYLRWQLFYGRVHTLDSTSRGIVADFLVKVSDYNPEDERENLCAVLATSLLPEEVGALYTKSVLPAAAQKQADDVIGHVSAALATELERVSWLSKPTRALARNKQQSLRIDVGVASVSQPGEKVGPRFGGVHGANALAASRTYTERELRKLRSAGQPLVKPGTVVNATYNLYQNAIFFPAAFLQEPVFAQSFATPVRYGALGWFAGHELTHAFDIRGAQFAAKGEKHSWWTQEDARLHANAAQCVVNQYQRFEAAPGMKIDAQVTAIENFADVGGLQLAYRAYRRASDNAPPPGPLSTSDGTSSEQQFFLAAAQTMCATTVPQRLAARVRSDPYAPERLRVNGAVTNMPEFAEAFHCPENSPMIPPQRCSLW